MDKSIVVYGSQYGATERYARRIAEGLGCEAVPADGIRKGQLAGYRTVVFGGGVYAGSFAGWKKIAPQCAAAGGRGWILFVCGLADPAKEKTQNEARMLFEKRLPAALAGKLPVFCLRGGIDYPKLRTKHRVMMAMLAHFLRRKKDPSEEDRQLLATYGGKVDFFDPSSADAVIAAARNGTN